MANNKSNKLTPFAKTRKEKLAEIKKLDEARDNEFIKGDTLGDGTKDYGYEKGVGRIKSRERVGQYKRDREGARDMSDSTQKRGDQTQSYKKSDGSSETFDRLESGADKQTRSKKKQRKLDRETLKDYRKEKRATKIADKKGMSVSQAQDFMKNRKDRLNAAMGEFGKGLMGKEQNLENIKDRDYRRDGSGTQAEANKPFADSSTRTKSTYYDKVIEPAKRIKLTTPGTIGMEGNMDGLSDALKNNEDKFKKKQEAENIKKTVVPPKTSEIENNVDAGDQPMPRFNSSNQSGDSRKNIYRVPGSAPNKNIFKDMFKGGINWFGEDDATGSDFSDVTMGSGRKKVTDWWKSDGMTKDFNNTKRNQAGESIESFNTNQFDDLQDNINKFSSPNKKIDRSSIQGNMMNAKGRK